ncbi:MAG: sugar transferase [Clostridia bacterium]|nr:sugar transferase [Clostridia bacterium]
MSNTLAPVILFVYDRPDHAKQTLDALAANELAEQSELFVFCDGPKKESVIERNRQVVELITAEKERGRFASVTLTVSPVNKGLAASIIGGVTDIIHRYSKCIVVEDDLITSTKFLSYMNDALDFYKEKKSIFSISGFTYPLKALQKYPHDVYLSYRACSHGWATWSDRWDSVDWEVKDFTKLSRSLVKRYRFNRGGNDLYRMLRHQMRGERNSWAIRFCYSQSKQERYTIYPSKTLVKNIGFDGSGTHCQDLGRENNVSTVLTLNKPMLVDPQPDKKVLRDFKNQYQITFSEAIEWLWKKVFKSS